MRTEVACVQIAAPAAVLERVLLADGDLRAAGRVAKIEQTAIEASELRVTVTW
jgi:valyl-tRNA synthetase